MSTFTAEATSGAGAKDVSVAGALGLNMVDSRSDYSPYRVLILPDVIPVSSSLRQRLRAYLDAGGALLATFESGLTPDRQQFGLPELGVTKTGTDTRDREGQPVRGRAFSRNDYAEYVIPKGPMSTGLPETEHVMYMKGLAVKAAARGTWK